MRRDEASPVGFEPVTLRILWRSRWVDLLSGRELTHLIGLTRVHVVTG